MTKPQLAMAIITIFFVVSCNPGTQNIGVSKKASQKATKVCPSVYSPVCGQVPCPKGAHCFVPPTPETYSNTCELQHAGADFLYKGKCRELH